jgi:hypothetical protein
MKVQIAIGAVALVAAMGVVSADQWNKKTKLDVKETIMIPGKELPPGKYVMKLLDSQSNRHIVQIMNEDETKVEATILAIPNYKMQPSGDTELRYWESPAGTPPALRAWFYPGDNFGQEFAYPKDVAMKISAVNKQPVAWYTGEGSGEGLKSAEVHDADRGEAPPAQTATTPPAAEPSTVAQERQPAPEPAPAPAPVVAPEPAPAPEPVQVAQNRPPVEAPAAPAVEPAPAPAPQAPAAELPQTASPVWTAALAGFLLMASGLTLSRVRAAAASK